MYIFFRDYSRFFFFLAFQKFCNMFVPNKTTNQMKITKVEAKILANVLYQFKYDNIKNLTYAQFENLAQLELKLENFASTKILKNQTKQNEQTTN